MFTFAEGQQNEAPQKTCESRPEGLASELRSLEEADMYDEISLGREFFEKLTQFDGKIAAQMAARGCPHCRGPLHRSDYNRKPRGGLIGMAGEAFTRRFSLCCGREGCRRRSLPPSVRFLGRRVYLGAVMIIATIMALMLATARAATRVSGVAARTTRRWIRWWRGPFIQTPAFTTITARLVGIDIWHIPKCVLERFEGTTQMRIESLLFALADVSRTLVL